jgi:molybdopterin synthase sulfur carrier subunit
MRVKFFAYYRQMTGCREREVPAPVSMRELLVSLSNEYGRPVREKLLSPDGAQLGPDAIILINGRNIAHLGMLDAPLAESDVVAVFPLVAGG